jgi:hypothetical protein
MLWGLNYLYSDTSHDPENVTANVPPKKRFESILNGDE